jgi:hypothetical protein
MRSDGGDNEGFSRLESRSIGSIDIREVDSGSTDGEEVRDSMVE